MKNTSAILIEVLLKAIDKIGIRFDGTPDITNSVAIIQGGKIIGKYAKIFLASDSHHEDKKYFTPGAFVNVVPLNVYNS